MLVAIVASVGAVALLPAVACAEAWTNAYPLGPIHVQPSIVGITLFSESALDARTPTISIDGVAYRTFLDQGETSGHWTSNETLVDGVYTIHWTWVPVAGGSGTARLYCYPARMTNGLHSVTASVNDSTGKRLESGPWSFTLGVAPAIGAITPPAGKTVYSPTPEISAAITDNSGSFTVTATVNGVGTPVSTSGGKVTVLSPELADGTVAVAITVTDADGVRTSRIWDFNVSVTRELACASCHSAAAASPFMGPHCTECHTATSYTPPHGLDPDHQPGLMAVHEDGCKCHAYAADDSKLSSAIEAGDAVCEDCHGASRPYPEVNPVHLAAPQSGSIRMHQGGSFTADCSSCHSLSLLAVHENSCATCHSSAAANVNAAIAGWDGTCASCHVTKHATAGSGHDAVFTAMGCSGTTSALCHVGSALHGDIAGCFGACHSSSIGPNPSGPPIWTNGERLLVHQHFDPKNLNQSFAVPNGVTSLEIDAYGGAGSQGGTAPNAGAGGLGGHVHATLPVSPLSTLTLRVGSSAYRSAGYSSAGQPNGALGADGTLVDGGGAGGGSTSVRLGAQVLLEAGGGGGGAKGKAGGAGGALGTGVGGYRTGGVGASFGGGGGGGGWNGGVGGAPGEPGSGGTSFVTAGSATFTPGVRAGSGYLDLAMFDELAPATTSDVRSAYMARATIVLNASDAGGSGLKATRYRLDDGHEITGSSITVPGVGDGPITHTLEYYSIDNAGNSEVRHVATFTVTPDLTPPVTTSNAQPAYWGKAAILLKATADDSPVTATWYRLDGSSATTGTLIVSSVQGTHSLEFWSVDDIGNIEAHKTVFFDVRPEAPDHVTSRTFTYTGGEQFLDVPTGVSTLVVDLYGAQGGSAGSRTGGLGGYLRAFVPVDPATRLKLVAGGIGSNSNSDPYNPSVPARGYPNGGNGYGTWAAAGGGSSHLALLDGTILAEAGAGAGGGYGGFGGVGGAAGSGTRSPNGAAPRKTNPSDNWTYLGGGGGGWNGGAAGIGGTSRVSLGLVEAMTPGVTSGNGTVTVKWVTPDYAPPVTTSNALTSYVGAAAVSFNAADAGGWGVADTRYRLDGGAEMSGTTVNIDPPAAGTTSSHELIFWSVDAAGNREASHTVTFTVTG